MRFDLKGWFGFSAVGASLVALATLAGCGGGPVGEASLTVAALSSADVARVEVTIEGAGIAPPIVQELARAGAEWRGAIGGIPAGTDRTFTVVAYDGMNVEIYRGVSTGVTIVGDGTTTVAMVLQQSMSVTGMENPPDITSVTVVPGILAPSETASVVVQASDPDPGDTLSIAWTATGGTFADASLGATTWTAPGAEGTYTLTVTVTDSHGSSRSVSIDVLVTNAANVGTAQIQVTFNTSPTISRFAIDPGLVPAGGTANMRVTVSDPEGDPVTLSYSDDCGGTESAGARTFTAPATSPVTCTVTLTADDGRMGVAHATAVVYVDDEITGNHAPIIGTTFQSNWEAGTGDGVSFSVSASDVDGDALTYTWTATTGTFDGVPPDGAASNHWVSAGASATITVRVTDARSAWTEAQFEVAGATADSATWVATVSPSERIAILADGSLLAWVAHTRYLVDGTAVPTPLMWPTDSTTRGGAVYYGGPGNELMVYPDGVGGELVYSGSENKHAFHTDGTWAWSWLGPGCCDYRQIFALVRPTPSVFLEGTYNTFWRVNALTGGETTGDGFSSPFSDAPVRFLTAGDAGYRVGAASVARVRPLLGGTPVWAQEGIPLGASSFTDAAVAGDLAVIAVSSGAGGTGMIARQPADGAAPTIRAVGSATSPVVLSSSHAFVGVDHGGACEVTALNLPDLTIAWTTPTACVRALLLADDGRLYTERVASGGRTDIASFDAVTGNLQTTITGLTGAPVDLFLRDGHLYAQTSSRLYRFDVPAMNYPASAPWPRYRHDNGRTSAL